MGETTKFWRWAVAFSLQVLDCTCAEAGERERKKLEEQGSQTREGCYHVIHISMIVSRFFSRGRYYGKTCNNISRVIDAHDTTGTRYDLQRSFVGRHGVGLARRARDAVRTARTQMDTSRRPLSRRGTRHRESDGAPLPPRRISYTAPRKGSRRSIKPAPTPKHRKTTRREHHTAWCMPKCKGTSLQTRPSLPQRKCCPKMLAPRARPSHVSSLPTNTRVPTTATHRQKRTAAALSLVSFSRLPLSLSTSLSQASLIIKSCSLLARSFSLSLSLCVPCISLYLAPHSPPLLVLLPTASTRGVGKSSTMLYALSALPSPRGKVPPSSMRAPL